MQRDINQRGAVTALVLIAMAVVLCLALAYANAYREVRKARSHVNFLNAVAQIQLNIRNNVNDPGSWATTIADTANNPSMACISAQSCTTPTAPTNFILWPVGVPSYTNKSLAIFDATDATAGFDLDGNSCNTFTTTGNVNCPIGITMKWSTTGCTPAPCQPPITVQADVMYRPTTFDSFGQQNEALLTLTFQQSLVGAATSCSGAPPPAELALCTPPPYPHDKLVCTAGGWRCGTVYY